METSKNKIGKKMKAFIKEINFMKRDSHLDFGWGNGYVAIPKGHPLHGIDYDKIHDLIPDLTVNGGLTFSDNADNLNWDELPEKSEGSWVVGFDTLHIYDTLDKWSKEAVMEEAERLKNQLSDYMSV